MSATFVFTIATPDGLVAKGECDFMVVPTAGGELGVMADHAALVACVAPGTVRFSTGTTAAKTVGVGPGLVDVRDNEVRILVSSVAKVVS